MKVLCFDTAMAACSAAVIDGDRNLVLSEGFEAMARGHAEALAPMVSAVMRKSGIGYEELGGIAVTTGPGTFTGVRIGLSFARGLGLALGIPVSGIDSLSALAANEPAPVPLLVATAARNEEAYVALFDERRSLLVPPQVMPVDTAAEGAPPGCLVLGSAGRAAIAASKRTDLLPSTACDLPVAARFATLAISMEPGSSPAPLYLRAPDARPQPTALGKIRGLTVEPAGPAASPLLARLHAEVFAAGWSAAAFAALLETPGTAAAIALHGSEPVGFVLTRAAADEAEIITIGTRPSAQRRGVARKLLEHHMTSLAARGVDRLFLEVASSNAAARALYAALGFSEAGRRKEYYQQAAGAEDAIVMCRELRA